MFLAPALLGLCVSCATVPPGPPPDVVRLQNDLDRLHTDPRIADNAGAELGNADAAVATLARNARVLDARAYQQGVYLSDRLVKLAEASALARYAEQRGTQLGAEREQLLARANTRNASSSARLYTYSDRATGSRRDELVPRSRAELMAMQNQLGGLESRVDDRGLVVRLGDFMFEPGQSALTPTAQQSLDSLARAMQGQPNATARIESYGAVNDGSATTARAVSVRDYLNARGVDLARIDVRGERMALRSGDERGSRVDVVVQTTVR
jgi:outer membrane protein OmpA-like peptidoglycan-associated protein